MNGETPSPEEPEVTAEAPPVCEETLVRLLEEKLDRGAQDFTWYLISHYQNWRAAYERLERERR
ncbi:MAG: hypothetical protein PHI23_04770 [Candidatus Peribacteraceae bacterium]|nr:hypothetical protein [Candidatus Peribacteraceae bacterium]